MIYTSSAAVVSEDITIAVCTPPHELQGNNIQSEGHLMPDPKDEDFERRQSLSYYSCG